MMRVDIRRESGLEPEPHAHTRASRVTRTHLHKSIRVLASLVLRHFHVAVALGDFDHHVGVGVLGLHFAIRFGDAHLLVHLQRVVLAMVVVAMVVVVVVVVAGGGRWCCSGVGALVAVVGRWRWWHM